jgi:TolB-like protein
VVPGPSDDRLESWKKIAAYLGRGVRTVRRWEADEGLPVHRHMHRVLGSVYAYKSEIDAWRRRDGRLPAEGSTGKAHSATPGRPAPSIAVLPFTNLSTDPENAYFAEGLAAEVIADLSKVRALRVISRTSSTAIRGSNRGIKAIAVELGVRYVLEGSVRRAGGRLRITAQLVDARTDSHLWADKYDGSVEDVFAIQESLARVIVEALKLRLTDDEDRRLAERPIGDVRAYDCYLRARHESWRWRKDAIDQAVQLLQDGLAIVGENARLQAALGLAYLQYREAGIDFSDRPLEAAGACARKVLAMEPRSAAGAQLRGWIHYSSGRIQEAVHDLKAALETDASDPDTLLLLSNCYLISGRVPAARPLIDRLLAVDPLTPVTRCMPAWADILEGNFAPALEPYRQMFDMDPGNPMARLFYVWVLALNARKEEAARIAAGFPPEVQNTVPARIAAFLAGGLGDKRPGPSAIETPELASAAHATDVFPRLLAHGYMLYGMEERAIHWLTVAAERGFVNYPYLAAHDPFSERLRNLPEFRRLLSNVKHRWQEFEA